MEAKLQDNPPQFHFHYSTPKEAALAYAARGWRVLPLHSIGSDGQCDCGFANLSEEFLHLNPRRSCAPGKHPRNANGRTGATTEIAKIEEWWRMAKAVNVGIATGTESGLVVIDIDPDHGGEASLDKLEKDRGKLPDTLTVQTGSGGWHFYFQHPGPEFKILTGAGGSGPNKKGGGPLAPYPGVDSRGDGGYVVAPPSNHVKGGYSWLYVRDIAPLPLAYVELLTPRPNAAHRSFTDGGVAFVSHDEAAQYWLTHYLNLSAGGNRNNFGFLLALQLRDLRLAEHEAEVYMREFQSRAPSGDHPYVEGEALASLHSAYSQPPRAPGRRYTSGAPAEAAPNVDPNTTQEASAFDVEEFLDWIRAYPDVKAVFACVDRLAMLDTATLGAVKAELKAILGAALNLNDFTEALNERRRKHRSTVIASPGLTDIVVSNRPLRDIGLDSIAAITQANEPPVFFRRGRGLARIASEATDSVERPVISTVGQRELAGRLTDIANFWRVSGEGEPVHVNPSDDLTGYLLQSQAWQLPALAGITETPTLRPDGTLFTEPGYDPQTRLYYRPDSTLQVPPIPKNPTKQDAERAIRFVGEAIHDFPFVGDADRANALALLLTPILRPAIKGHVPLALVDAPSPGSGKSLIARVLSMIVLGRDAQMQTACPTEEEWFKAITSMLDIGSTVIIIDNISRTLDSANLCAALTAPTWQGRLLGTNITGSWPQRATWIANGNNIRLGGDMPRRCYRIHLDPKLETPWQREGFLHPDLLAWVRDQRGALLCALLTAVRAWYVAGCPKAGGPTLGSFTEWAEAVGGILAYAGVPGFLTNLEEIYKNTDDEKPAWRSFFAAWHEQWPAQGVKVADIVEHLQSEHDKDATQPKSAIYQALPDDLLDALARRTIRHKLGKALSARADLRYTTDGLRVERVGVEHHAMRWRVVCNTDQLMPPSDVGEFGSLGSSTQPNTGNDTPPLWNGERDGESEGGESLGARWIVAASPNSQTPRPALSASIALGVNDSAHLSPTQDVYPTQKMEWTSVVPVPYPLPGAGVYCKDCHSDHTVYARMPNGCPVCTRCHPQAEWPMLMSKEA